MGLGVVRFCVKQRGFVMRLHEREGYGLALGGGNGR